MLYLFPNYLNSKKLTMKNFYFILFILFTNQFVFSQYSGGISQNNTISYETVDVKPEFPNGFREFMKYIGSNFRLPEIEGFSGIVNTSFIIELNGSITNVKILKDIGEGTADEAKRVLLKSPLWKPGEQDGQKVRVQMTLPITLRVN